ncbi:hypothetical protein MTO96_020039 [Rhipicephalus appendiculatus]
MRLGSEPARLRHSGVPQREKPDTSTRKRERPVTGPERAIKLPRVRPRCDPRPPAVLGGPIYDRRRCFEEACDHVDDIVSVLIENRADAAKEFTKIFGEASRLLSDVNVEMAMPRTVLRQNQRCEMPAANPEDYYRRNVYLPFLADLETQLKERFENHRSVVVGVQMILPKYCASASISRITDAAQFYLGGVDVSAGSRCPFSSGSHCKASLTSTLPDEKRRRELVDFFESTTLDIIKSVGPEQAAEVLESLNRRVIEATHISNLCPRRRLRCHADLPFRQPDGICNNLEHPEWGSAGVCERRILSPEYGDGVSSPRKARSGRPLPSSRLISLLVHDGSGLFREPDERVSQLSIGFGQFLGHDLGFTPFLRLSPLELKMGREPGELSPDDAMPIKVPDKDPLSARFHQSTLPFFDPGRA